MSSRSFGAVAALILAAAWSGPAGAEVLTLGEIYALQAHVTCVADCGPAPAGTAPYTAHATWHGCVVACGQTESGWSPPPRQWEKNGVWPIDTADHELALLEYWHHDDPNDDLICYADPVPPQLDEDGEPLGKPTGTIVIPGALCADLVCADMPECSEEDCAADPDAAVECDAEGSAGPICWWPDSKRPAACPDVVCEAGPVHTLQECADADGDGKPAWLEAALGTDPDVADPLCSTEAPCAFDEVCTYDPDLGAGQCQERFCEGPCTAFHLTMVAQDDQEVIVHVFYDHTPVPARVLDLYVEYDHAALTLHDSRALAPLALQGKQLATSHDSAGVMRLSVFDTGGTHPIPTGPIVELVFRRHTQDATEIAFTTDDALQAKAVAPLQHDEALQSELTNDALWGPPVVVPSLDEVTTWLRLWYGFDSGSAALSYANVPTAEELCAAIVECANDDDEVRQARFVARLEELQQGLVVGPEEIAGPSGSAAYLDGWADHLRLPVHPVEPRVASAQSFSASLWFYGEGNSASELKTSPQILMSHLTFGERTRFGLLLEPGEDTDTLRLVFFVGDLLSKAPPPVEVVVADGIVERTWHHAGLALNAQTGAVDLYLDGERLAQAALEQPPAAISCPQFIAATDVLLHEEGAVLGGSPPSRVYLAVEETNRFAIHRMDPAGLAAVELLSDPEHSFQDPDYSPLVDKLVYSSNITGDFEIWIAEGDGSDQRQLTLGFGDAALGVTARRPRWAPDASGIVFDSNAFSVSPADNDLSRVRHLYYIGYDAGADAVAIEGPDGEALDQLDYGALVAADAAGDVRPTGGAADRHHWDARWLTGADPDGGGLGELVMATADPDLGGGRVHRLALAGALAQSTASEIPGLGGAEHELRLLAARRGEQELVLDPTPTERLLYERTSAEYVPSAQFYAYEGAAEGEVLKVPVVHSPSGYAPDCWDVDGDGAGGTLEDRNDDQVWDVEDCYPHEARNLYVRFDAAAWTPVLEDEDGNPQHLGSGLLGMNKSLELQVVYAGGHAFVRVEVRSPLDATPIPDAAQIAVLDFLPIDGAELQVPPDAYERVGLTELLVKDLLSDADPVPLSDPSGLVESVDDAVFSPDGDRLLLSAYAQSAPALLATAGATTLAGAQKILLEPASVRGLAWTRRDQLMACEWIGGYQHPQSKALQWGLRGGLDDLKVYSGLRDPDAFRSEAERGLASLDAAGLGGQVESKLPGCTDDHLECPPYHLCVDSECVMLACDPDVPDPPAASGLVACSDHGSLCTQRPLGVEQEFTGPQGGASYEWVCAAECTFDAECYAKPCKNGPCRFCDPATRSCIECRQEIQLLGELPIVAIEGCPDATSFRCEDGTCVTECYAIGDDQSVYLCDPAIEYCEQGQCVLHEWSWWDLSPASFAGGPTGRRAVPADPDSGWHGATQAVDQRVPVAITAYGVADHGAPPEVVVEARGGPFYGGEWHRIGEAVVHARTAVEAEAAPISLSSPWVFDSLRLRLVTSPYDNVGAAGTGLAGGGDEAFCLADLAAAAAATGEEADPAVCYRRAQGSVHHLGYRAELPWHEAVAACIEHGAGGCPPLGAGGHEYLWGGQPAAVVLAVEVDGGSVMNAVTSDAVCAYGGYGAGATSPADEAGPKKLLYGDISTEQSPAKDAFCAADPAACASPGESALVEFPHEEEGFVLLNCNVHDPAKGGETAGAVFQGIPIVRPWPATSGVIVQDTGDTCLMAVEPPLTTPCWAWQDDKVSLDPLLSAVSKGDSMELGLLELGYFTSFGHDGGFTTKELPSYPLEVAIYGYTGEGLEIDCGGGPVAVVADDGQPVVLQCPYVKQGKQVVVEVVAQPTGTTQTCTVVADAELALKGMPSNLTTVDVACAQLVEIGGLVTGLTGGGLKLLGSLQIGVQTSSQGSVSSLYAKETLAIGADGPFSFQTMISEAGSYTVGVQAHPPGQVCEVTGGFHWKTAAEVAGGMGFEITCSAAQPQAITAVVHDQQGEGLELLEMHSGATVKVPPNQPWGEALAVFPVELLPGTPYAVKIIEQPWDAHETCKIDGGSVAEGVMLTTTTQAATVKCTTLPTWTVPVQVTGLAGQGLSLRLNSAEVLPIETPSAQTETVSSSFQTALTEGTPWSVEVHAQPTDPAQLCAVTASTGAGVIDGKAVPAVLVTCDPPDPIPATYTVGGTLADVKGSGLELELGYGAQTLTAAVGDTTFVFSTPVLDGASYHVVVSKQPTAPTQHCTVTGGEGEVSGADVTDIAVTCVDAAWITVEVKREASDGAHVRARLYSSMTAPEGMGLPTPGQLVAVQPDKAKLKGGKVVFLLADVHDDDEPAPVPPGTYYLIVELNHDGDYDSETSLPLYDAGDYGAAKQIVADPQTTNVLTFEESDLEPLKRVDLVAGGLDLWLWNAGDLRCWWTPYVSGVIGVPPGPLAPVAGQSELACHAGEDHPDEVEPVTGCFGQMNKDLLAVPPLPFDDEAALVPSGTYNVICWADTDEDGVLGSGDLLDVVTGVMPALYEFWGLPTPLFLEPTEVD